MSDFSIAAHVPPEILVVIVNYNGGELLARAAVAMECQTLTEYHLIVVDNASSDDSIAALRGSHPDTEVLLVGANLGFAAANNLAVQRFRRSRQIALLNRHVFPEPDWLRTLVDMIRAGPNVAALMHWTLA